MDEVLMIDEMTRREKEIMRYDEYEVLGMVYDNDFEGEGREYRDKVRNFYHILAKDDQIIFFRFGISRNGFYKKNEDRIAPIIKEDVIESIEFSNTYDLSYTTGMDALNHMLGTHNTDKTICRFKKSYGFAHIEMRHTEIKIIKVIESYEDISKNYFLENKDEILEQFNFIKLNETAPIMQHEQNYFLPILEKFLSYHKELIKIYTTKLIKLEPGKLGIAQNGSVYLSLGKSSYELGVKSEYTPDRIYRIMPDETLDYHTYLVMDEIYKKHPENLSDLFEKIKDSVENNSFEEYLDQVKLSKTPVKVHEQIAVISESDLIDYSVIEFDFSNTALRQLVLKVSSLKRIIYKLDKLKFVRK